MANLDGAGSVEQAQVSVKINVILELFETAT